MFSFFCGFPNLIQRINSVWVQVIFINYSFTSYNLLFSDLNILNLIISKGKGSLWFVVVEFTGALKQLPCHLFWSFLPWIVLTPICTFFLTFRHLRIYWQLAHWGCFCKDSFMGCINLSFLLFSRFTTWKWTILFLKQLSPLFRNLNIPHFKDPFYRF